MLLDFDWALFSLLRVMVTSIRGLRWYNDIIGCGLVSGGDLRSPDDVWCGERALARASKVSVSSSAMPSATADQVTITSSKNVGADLFLDCQSCPFFSVTKKSAKKEQTITGLPKIGSESVIRNYTSLYHNGSPMGCPDGMS